MTVFWIWMHLVFLLLTLFLGKLSYDHITDVDGLGRTLDGRIDWEYWMIGFGFMIITIPIALAGDFLMPW